MRKLKLGNRNGAGSRSFFRMKTLIFLLTASCVLVSACSTGSHHGGSSRSSSNHSGASAMTYGQATESQQERYGGRLQSTQPGAANYDPTTGRGHSDR